MIDIHGFSNALYMAYWAGELSFLRNYVDAGKPIPEYDVSLPRMAARMPLRVLVDQLLGRCPPSEDHRIGRRQRVASEAPIAEQAERNAAWRVAFEQKDWREHHGPRVTSEVTAAMIATAIAEAAKTLKIPADTIKERNVRTFLKNGSVVVH